MLPQSIPPRGRDIQSEGPASSQAHIRISTHDDNEKPTGGKRRRLVKEFRALKADLLEPLVSGCKPEDINEQVRILEPEDRHGLINRMDQGVFGYPNDLQTLLEMRCRILLRATGAEGQCAQTPVQAWIDTLLNVALRTNGNLHLSPEQKVIDEMLRFNLTLDVAVSKVRLDRPGSVLDLQAVSSLAGVLGIRNIEDLDSTLDQGMKLGQANLGAYSEEQVSELKSSLEIGQPLATFLRSVSSLSETSRELLLRRMGLDTDQTAASFTEFLDLHVAHEKHLSRLEGKAMPEVLQLWTESLLTWCLTQAGVPKLSVEERLGDSLVRNISSETAALESNSQPSNLATFTSLVEILRPQHLERRESDPAFSRLERNMDLVLSSPRRQLYQLLLQGQAISALTNAVLSLTPEVRDAIAVIKHFTPDASRFGIYQELNGCIEKHLPIFPNPKAQHVSPVDIWIYSVMASALRTVKAQGTFWLSPDQTFVDNIIRFQATPLEAWKKIPSELVRDPQKLKPIGKYLWLRFVCKKAAIDAEPLAFAAGTIRTPVEHFIMRLADLTPNLADVHLKHERQAKLNAYYIRAMQAFLRE